MTREERALKNLKQMCSDGRYLGSGSYAPLEVLEDFEVAIKALEQKPRWTPVSKGLPNIHNYSENYYVTLECGEVCIAMFTECDGNHWWSHDDVVAWMPLTIKPYKSKKS